MFGQPLKDFDLKPGFLTVILLATIIGVSTLDAQQIYTWTDENGILHISDQAPPKDVNVDEVLKYREKTPQEQAAIEREIEKQRQRIERQNRIDAARQAELEARQAEEKARQVRAAAQEELRVNQEYVKQLSTRRWKRRKFKKRIERIKIETEASLAEAEATAQQAEETARKARQAAAAAREAQ